MKDIFEDPEGFARTAAGTPVRLLLSICVHVVLLALALVFDHPVFLAAPALALPALYLYALYRLSKEPSASDPAHHERLERTAQVDR